VLMSAAPRPHYLSYSVRPHHVPLRCRATTTPVPAVHDQPAPTRITLSRARPLTPRRRLVGTCRSSSGRTACDSISIRIRISSSNATTVVGSVQQPSFEHMGLAGERAGTSSSSSSRVAVGYSLVGT
jgi:hypothetical protein